MHDKMRKVNSTIALLKNKPYFLFLLPLFFVLHGFTEYFNAIPVKDALLLILVYTGSSLMIAGLFWLFYRNFIKASIVAFLVMAYHFFFGSFQDYLKDHFHGTFIARYSFILPVSFLFFIAAVTWLKKRKNPLNKIILYLNVLFLFLLAADTGWLFTKIFAPKEKPLLRLIREGFFVCDTCKKPDIYFVLLDEYTGNTALKEKFNFDNADFESELAKRGFYVVRDSRSNYNFTPYSVASILNMNYLELNMKTRNAGNLNYAYGTINNNLTLTYLSAEGYRFYNYSIFDFRGQPSLDNDNFLPVKTKLITSQTFFNRLEKDILFNITTGKWKFKAIQQRSFYNHLHNNEKFIRLTEDAVSKTSSSPKFIYTHLLMPHYPYYFDSKGNPLPADNLAEGSQSDQHNYKEYLQYCNNKILDLTDHILSASSSPPVIILLGDHGYRNYQDQTPDKYYFLNLDAVYFPEKNYNSFYDGMTNANLFRTLFNTEFHQHLPLLKDSTVYLWR
ncbi:MAG: hypothetical protein ACHQEB_04245 [Chitinophagales bacterium]